jgi:hypothetical protein
MGIHTWISGTMEYRQPDLYFHVKDEVKNGTLRPGDSADFRDAYAELRHLTEAEAFRKIADDMAERDRLEAKAWRLHLAGKDTEADDVDLAAEAIDNWMDDYLAAMLRRRYGSACAENDPDDEHNGHSVAYHSKIAPDGTLRRSKVAS